MRVLVTGSTGMIGRRLVPALRAAGYDVLGIQRVCRDDPSQLSVDLLDAHATAEALRGCNDIGAVVHLAALAHGQRAPVGETCLSANEKMTGNLLLALRGRPVHWVLASSVAVYGEADREQPVSVTATPRPSTTYGLSKLMSEKLVLSAASDVDILRLAPVFDKESLKDVGKRVYLPGTRLRMRMSPPPLYSLCGVDVAVVAVIATLARGHAGHRVHNVIDAHPYAQSQLVDMFPGLTIPVWLPMLAPCQWLFGIVPGKRGYALRCLYHKLFQSNIYAAGSASIPSSEFSQCC